jgi:DNA modification methylase
MPAMSNRYVTGANFAHGKLDAAGRARESMSDVITWTPCTAELGDLKPWERNPKTISKSHAKRLLANWQKLGQWQTIAIGPACEVYDGHQRLSVLLAAYGTKYEIKALQSDRPLTDDERGQIVFEGTVGSVGQIDWEQVSGFDASALAGWGLDADTLADWKRDTSALDNFIKSEQAEPVDAEPQVDRAAELNEKWQVVTGDLWQIGEHRLLCGDSTVRADVERVMGGEKADCVLTDPPYGMDLDTDWSSAKSNLDFVRDKHAASSGNKYERVIGDSIDFDPSHIFEFFSCDEIFLFGADYYADKLPDRNGGSWIIWDKRLDESADKMFGSCFETCWSKNKHKRDIARIKWAGIFGTEKEPDKKRLHPTQKPVALFAWFIEKYTDENNVVVDLYAGVGGNIVACQNLQRKCRAVEISNLYCSVILERMSVAFPGIEIKRLE